MDGFDFDLVGALEGVSFQGCWFKDKRLALGRGGDWTRRSGWASLTAEKDRSLDDLRRWRLLFPIFVGFCLLEIATRARVRVAAPTRGRFKARPVSDSVGRTVAGHDSLPRLKAEGLVEI